MWQQLWGIWSIPTQRDASWGYDWPRGYRFQRWWFAVSCGQCWSNVERCWVSGRVHIFKIIEAEAIRHKYSRLSGDLKLLQLKAAHGWTDKSFKQLLDLLKDMLPEGNQVAGSVYEAKKIICPLGLEVERIHACKNNYVLFREEYEDLDNWPKCGFGCFKRTKDGRDNNAEDRNKLVEIRGRKGSRGGPVSVSWYFSIIPRLKRMFATRKEAQLLRWHKEGRNKTGG